MTLYKVHLCPLPHETESHNQFSLQNWLFFCFYSLRLSLRILRKYGVLHNQWIGIAMFWQLQKEDYKTPPTSSRGNHLPLILAQIGRKLAVASIEGGQQIQSRLADFGVFPQSEIKIINRSSSGPITILVKNSRIALGRDLGCAIMVQESL